MPVDLLAEQPKDLLANSTSQQSGKSVWSALGAEITPQMKADYPQAASIAQNAQDIATIPANFFNQLLLNLPRAALNKAGYDFPSASNPTTKNVANVAGVAGAISNPLRISNPIVAGLTQGALYSTKDNLGLDAKSLQNRAVNAATGGAAGGVMAVVGKAFNSGDVINRFIGTRKKDFLFGKNPGQAVANEGIIASSPDNLSEQISGKLKEYGQKINDTVSGSSRKINATDIASKFDAAMNDAARNNDQNLVNRLAEVKTAISNKLVIDQSTGNIQVQFKRNLNSLSPLEATEIKRIIGEKAKFTGNPSDDKLVNNVLRDAYGTLRRKIEKVVPEVAPLNQRYADLKTANIAIARKDFSKTPIASTLLGVGRGVVGGLLLSSGNPWGAAVGSIAEPLLERAANNARTKTIQAMIYKGGELAKQKVAGNNQELIGISNILNKSENQ